MVIFCTLIDREREAEIERWRQGMGIDIGIDELCE